MGTHMTKGVGLAAAAIVLSVAAVGAIERTTMPVFALTDAAGRTVSSHQVTRPGNWLLLYVGSDCASCDVVLGSIGQDDAASLAPGIVVVVGTTDVGDLARAMQRYPSLAGASWYADAADGARALRVTSAPVVFGGRGGTIEWSVTGVLGDATDIKAIMSSWLKVSEQP
jgi:hypothetical protein